MTKKEFDELYVGEKIIVKCTTKNQSDTFLNLAMYFGYEFDSLDVFVAQNLHHIYDDYSFYNVLSNRCGDLFYLQRKLGKCNILYFDTAIRKNVEDLRYLLEVERVVELRGGVKGFILPNRVLFEKGWTDLESFNQDLTHIGSKEFDIVSIYESKITEKGAWHFGVKDNALLNKVWERNWC